MASSNLLCLTMGRGEPLRREYQKALEIIEKNTSNKIDCMYEPLVSTT